MTWLDHPKIKTRFVTVCHFFQNFRFVSGNFASFFLGFLGCYYFFHKYLVPRLLSSKGIRGLGRSPIE